MDVRTCSKLVEVAELLDGVNMIVEGDCDTSYLTKGTTYEVVYVVMMNMSSYGWTDSVTFKLVDPKGKVTKRKMRLDGMPVNTWEYVPVGVFKNDTDQQAGKVQFSMSEVDSQEQKKGLIVKGVAIRPKH
ncbi:hypothetical protein Sjap_003771 [Stephania japonica]|uniref:Uncharacterized protein n=1 Tax=Stephania japonica TaxID=461633 RepID=A0AAP0KPG5_9MAGN